jgi:hypothetical protein
MNWRKAAQGWFLNDRRDQETKEKPLYYDEHNLSQQRAYQILCLMVGSDLDKFKGLADQMKMPETRQLTCKRDFAKTSEGWQTVLKPWLREPGDIPAYISFPELACMPQRYPDSDRGHCWALFDSILLSVSDGH